MTPDAIANCTRLRKSFDNREAIYVDQGAFRVRVTAIHTDVVAQTITANIAEIPTPGFPRFLGFNTVGLVTSSGLNWTIGAGSLTAFSDHVWSHGNGGWSLFFDSELIEEIVRFAATYSVALDLEPYQRYRNILGWLQCHKSTQGRLTGVFGGDDRTGDGAQRLPEPPTLLAEGITFEDSGRTLRWGTPLHELVDVEAANTKWRPGGMFLCWRNRICLGGFPCEVGTGRSFGPPEPRRYHSYLEEFHWVSLVMNVQWHANDAARKRGFREVYARLERGLGPATFSYPPFEGRLLSIHWEFRGMDIGYRLEGAAPSVYICHDADGYPALRADARALRRWQGRGARVDYVAWAEPEDE